MAKELIDQFTQQFYHYQPKDISSKFNEGYDYIRCLKGIGWAGQLIIEKAAEPYDTTIPGANEVLRRNLEGYQSLFIAHLLTVDLNNPPTALPDDIIDVAKVLQRNNEEVKHRLLNTVLETDSLYCEKEARERAHTANPYLGHFDKKAALYRKIQQKLNLPAVSSPEPLSTR